MRRFLQLSFPLVWILAVATGRAESPAFDLTGPKVDVHVKRGAVTLPISETPNLLPGDRLWIHPDLPSTQSEHFVLVVAFLRGTTNPPPEQWFTRVETWTKEAHDEGIFVTVPEEAQQALVFLAPETGGDFNTLRKAVRDQPGSFVRAAQDLQQASWERQRLETYLSDVKITSKTDPDALKTHAELAARSLGIKINESCFVKPADQQASCLSQTSEGMVLDDANAQGLVNQIANGSALDLVNQLSTTSMAGGGMYSAYVGAVVDTAKILSSLHTAHFQYIPALALPTTDTLNLRLNMPPSFRNPKSVVVIALPPVGPTHAEVLYAVNPAESFCALKPAIVLPAAGAPLLFATPMAHDLTLRVQPDTMGRDTTANLTDKQAPGPVLDLPVQADPMQGGLTFSNPLPALPSGILSAQLHGKWGFDDWDGPTFHLYAPEPGKWAIASGDQSALVVGREDELHIVGANTQCVEQITAQSQNSSASTLAWEAPKPDTLDVKVPLKEATPGAVTLTIAQYGLAKPDALNLTAYDSAASLTGFTLSAGDAEAILKGTRLDQVKQATLHNIAFTPANLTRAEDLDQLALKAGASTAGLDPGKTYTAQVELKDGRRLTSAVTVQPPRPQILVLSRGVQDPGSGTPLPPVQFGSPNDVPIESRFVFFVKSTSPATFPRNERIEVAAADSSFDTMLSLADGSLLLADSSTAQASVQPSTRFGYSAFGPVRVRAVASDGQTGDWLPLGTLVRLPAFKDLRCPRATTKPCVLTGNNLFLATSVAVTQQFEDATQVPPEFTGTQLIVPHPVNGTLYFKLRDDPGTVQTVNLPATTISPAEEKSESPAVQPTQPLPTPTPSPDAGEAPASTAPATNLPPSGSDAAPSEK